LYQNASFLAFGEQWFSMAVNQPKLAQNWLINRPVN